VVAVSVSATSSPSALTHSRRRPKARLATTSGSPLNSRLSPPVERAQMIANFEALAHHLLHHGERGELRPQAEGVSTAAKGPRQTIVAAG
jgi:hypothetical protein